MSERKEENSAERTYFFAIYLSMFLNDDILAIE